MKRVPVVLIAALALLSVRADAGKSTISMGGNWEFSGDVSSPGGAGAVEINAELTPDNDAIPGQVSGDAYGLTVAPLVNISRYSIGPVGRNAHKWVASQRLALPRLQGGGGTGKPQSLIGLQIIDPPGVETRVEDALLEAWALHIGTTLGSKMAGALQVGSPGTTAQALQFGSGGGSRWNNMLWVTGKRQLLPYGAAATGDAYSAFIETKVSTAPSGRHPNIAGAHIATPEIESSNGATVDTYTTLRVGNAPADGTAGFASTKRRALWVGTGQSEIEGQLSVAALRVRGGPAPASYDDPSGEAGEIRWDANWLYIKTGRTWKRARLSW